MFLIEGVNDPVEACPYTTADERRIADGSARLLAAIIGKPVQEPRKQIRAQLTPPKPRKGNKRTVGRMAGVREANARRKAAAAYAGPTARRIIGQVADWFEIPAETIIGADRKRSLVTARFVAIRLLAETTTPNGNLRYSKAQVGRIVGGRDHTSVLHALNVFDARARLCPLMTEAYEALKGGAL